MADIYPRPLTERERAVLAFMLSVDEPRLDALREQARSAFVAEPWEDGCASIDLGVDRRHAPRSDVGTAGYDTLVVETRSDGTEPRVPYELLLFVRDGWLKSIEIVHYVPGEVPVELPPPTALEDPLFVPTVAIQERRHPNRREVEARAKALREGLERYVGAEPSRDIHRR